MKSISTEGNNGAKMEAKKKVIIVLAALIILIIANSFYITSLSILDTDPSTYAIVPILMLPVFAFFMGKHGISQNVKIRDIAIGVLLFLIFLVATLYLRKELSYLFLSYRIDLLLLSLVLASLITLMFGFSNLRKFKALILYSLIASPIVLMAIIKQNLNFAVFNTIIIYKISGLFFKGVSYLPPITITANGYSVGIGESCIGIGAIIGIVLFLIPIAYFYSGKISRKLLWVFSGFALMFILNVLRMLAITTAWFFYGPSNAILAIHIFAGVLLFYASIIAMILIAGRFGLTFPKREGQKNAKAGGYEKYGLATAILISIGYYLLSMNYSTSYYLSPISISTTAPNFNSSLITPFVDSVVTIRNSTEVVIVNSNGTIASATYTSRTINNSKPIALFITQRKLNFSNNKIPSGGLGILGQYSFLSSKGTTETIYDIISSGGEYLVYYGTLPYRTNSSSAYAIHIYVIFPYPLTIKASACSYYNGYSMLLNPQILFYNSTTVNKIKSSYCTIKSVVD